MVINGDVYCVLEAVNGTLDHGLRSRGLDSPDKSPKTHNRNNTAGKESGLMHVLKPFMK